MPRTVMVTVRVEPQAKSELPGIASKMIALDDVWSEGLTALDLARAFANIVEEHA